MGKYPIMTFTKITGWPMYKLFFNYKIHYTGDASKTKYDRCPKQCIIIPNHTHIFDALLVEHVFFRRMVRTITAEVMFNKSPFFAWFLRKRGHIEVKRGERDKTTIENTKKALEENTAVAVFAEGRLHKKGETGILPFHPGAVMFAVQTHSPILLMYARANYRFFKKTHVVLGEPIDVFEYIDTSKPIKEAAKEVCVMLRERMCELEKKYMEIVGSESCKK